MYKHTILNILFVSVLAGCSHTTTPNQEYMSISDRENQLIRSIENDTKLRNICLNLSEDKIENLDELDGRQLLVKCALKGYPSVQSAISKLVRDDGKNDTGAALEKYNRWGYIETPEGNFITFINLNNKTKRTISWIKLGFISNSCEHSTEYSFVQHLKLSQSITPHSATIVKWLVPQDVKMGEGCLDIIAAGQEG